MAARAVSEFTHYFSVSALDKAFAILSWCLYQQFQNPMFWKFPRIIYKNINAHYINAQYIGEI